MNARPAVRTDRRVADRRVDHATRQRVMEMTPDELRAALLTDELTELGNRRAWREAGRLPVQVFIDVDNLKYVNDAYGHTAGDNLLIAVGNVIGAGCEAGHARGYRFSGDEFVIEAVSYARAEELMDAIVDALATRSLGALSGIGISYGIAPTLVEAEALMREHKTVRTLTGERVARGQAPGGAQ